MTLPLIREHLAAFGNYLSLTVTDTVYPIIDTFLKMPITLPIEKWSTQGIQITSNMNHLRKKLTQKLITSI